MVGELLDHRVDLNVVEKCGSHKDMRGFVKVATADETQSEEELELDARTLRGDDFSGATSGQLRLRGGVVRIEPPNLREPCSPLRRNLWRFPGVDELLKAPSCKVLFEKLEPLILVGG